MSHELSIPARFRNAIRDSELDPTARLVAFTISTYMDSRGLAFPSKATIAAGAGLGKGRRAVDAAVDRLEAAGLVEISRSKGRRSFLYRASPATLNRADGATFEDANVAPEDAQRRISRRPTSHHVRTKAVESEKESILTGRGRTNARDFSEYDGG